MKTPSIHSAHSEMKRRKDSSTTLTYYLTIGFRFQLTGKLRTPQLCPSIRLEIVHWTPQSTASSLPCHFLTTRWLRFTRSLDRLSGRAALNGLIIVSYARFRAPSNSSPAATIFALISLGEAPLIHHSSCIHFEQFPSPLWGCAELNGLIIVSDAWFLHQETPTFLL